MMWSMEHTRQQKIQLHDCSVDKYEEAILMESGLKIHAR